MKRFILLLVCFLFVAPLVLAQDKGATITKTPTETPKPGIGIPGGECCISGKYLGSKTDTSCVPRRTPERKKFSMDITQAARCGSSWQGTVTDSDGKITTFSGNITAGPGAGCCTVDAVSTTGTDNIRIKGLFCKRGTKWEGKGSFEDRECKGTWEMNQQ
jgi:hypothetical protein